MTQPHPIISELKTIVGQDNVLDDPRSMIVYECDGFPVAKGMPLAVVFPTTTTQVSKVLKALNQYEDIQMITRGSGTGLAGGCVSFGNGVIVSTGRMRNIIEIDIPNRIASVQAGVRNLELTDAVRQIPGGEKLHFSPDPSSQRASTIGGNAATNAGGIHTLKHGVTTNHILGMEYVTTDGQIHKTRAGNLSEGVGPDLPGLLCGSEGTLALITQLWVKLVKCPDAFRTVVGIFDSSVDATQAVADIIGAGIIPAAMEMMDGAMVKVVEDTFHYGFPADAQALLLIEIDGIEDLLDAQMQTVAEICRNAGADDVQCSADPEKRAELWSARKKAFGAIGKISPSYCTQDACVPRSKLPEVIDKIMSIGDRYGLQITNVFHAGDGNVHPILLFDEDDAEQVKNVMHASHEILEYCISIGGALTGEHGVGVEKLPLMKVMFTPATMQTFAKVKAAFDPNEQVNTGKLIPSTKVVIDLLENDAAPGTKSGTETTPTFTPTTNSPGGAL